MKDAVTPYQAYRIGSKVSELVWPEYQVILAVHENTDELQISAILRSPEQWGGCKPVALMGPNW